MSSNAAAYSRGVIDGMEWERLGEALAGVGFTHDAVVGLLGPEGHAALGRNETTPGLRATREGSPLATLTRLFLLQAPVDAAALDAALPGLAGPLGRAGVIEHSGDEVRARLDVRPYAADDLDLWVLSDLTPGMDGSPNAVGPDHVLGISPAATSLAQLTIRRPVGRALDLGCGCGVQALHLAEHADHVVATDVNLRALAMTRANARLNGATGIDVRDGSFFEPVAGERFDLIASNPPFVISPADGERLVYRDSGLPGDSAVEHLVRQIPDFLNPGGTAHLLVNWMVLRDRPWGERLASWISEDVDAWVVQREVADLPSYVELWLKDSGHHGAPDYHERYDAWLGWLEQQGAEGVGFGWITLRARELRTGGTESPNSRPQKSQLDRRLEDWPWEVEQPVAPEIAEYLGRVDWLRGHDDEALLRSRLSARVDVQQETFGAPGAADPGKIVLRQQAGLRRARQVDTVEAALVGACDGELTVGQILRALEQLLGEPVGDRAATVRDLVAEGFLVPPAVS